MHHECKGKVIASHTVSRSGSLGTIAKDGHVYSYKANIQFFEKTGGNLEPTLTGWKEASTFPGFCSHHDKQIFSPIEDEEFSGSLQQCFLWSYRSVAWEYYAKLRANKTNTLRKALVSQKAPALKNLVSDFNHANDLSLSDAAARKISFDEILNNENFENHHGLLIEFDGIFPIQCSAAWSPAADIHGNSLQILDDKPKTPAAATLQSFAANGKSYFLLAWHSNSATVASKLAESIGNLPENDIPKVIAALIFLTSENCHFSPDWYNSLSQAEKDYINLLAHPVLCPAVTPAVAGNNINIEKIKVSSIRNF